MEDQFLKYSKLYSLIFLSFLSIPVSIALLVAAFYGISQLVSSRPVDMVFELLIISLPAAVFSSVYTIFFIRTKVHPSKPVRWLSRGVFTAGFTISLVFLALDIFHYMKYGGNDITHYRSFNLFFLAGNIGVLFAIAILQAFTTEKEKDWLEKRKERENLP